MKRVFLILILNASILCQAQNFNAKSNTLSLDYSDPKNTLSSTAPKIEWKSPVNQTVFLKEGNIALDLLINSKTPLKSVRLVVRDKSSGEEKASTNIAIADEKKLLLQINKNLTLTDGVNEVMIIAENRDGLKANSTRDIHVGATALADAAKLSRKDYALIFATDKYDNWKALVNPVYDARTVAGDLQKTYGF
jgi:hypothetical protein